MDSEAEPAEVPCYGLLLMTDSSEVAESSFVALRLIGHDARCCFNDDIDPICYSVWVNTEAHAEAVEHISNVFAMYLAASSDDEELKKTATGLWDTMMREHGFGILMENEASVTEQEWFEAAIASAEFPIAEDLT